MSVGRAATGARHRRARPAGRRDRGGLHETARRCSRTRARSSISPTSTPSWLASDADPPDVIINCAAYNNVDLAEDEPDKALTANAFAVRVLARAARGDRRDARALQHRFRVRRPAPAGRTSKRIRRIRKACTRSRSCWENGLRWRRRARSCCASRASLAERMPRARSIALRRPLAEGREAKVFRDRVVSPSYVVDVAAATRALVERGEPGLYHCVGTGHANWYEVGLEIARVMGKEERRAPAAGVGRRRLASSTASAIRGARQRQAQPRRADAHVAGCAAEIFDVKFHPQQVTLTQRRRVAEKATWSRPHVAKSSIRIERISLRLCASASRH